jgi:flavin-binding protein dodecin
MGRAHSCARPAIQDELETEELIMSNVVKVIEVLAQSSKSWEDAAKSAVDEASRTLRHVRSVYIKDLEAKVENGKISEYRINAKISFDLEGDRKGKAM